MSYLYLLIDFLSVIVPVIFSFHPKLQFYKHWKAFFLANALVSLVFIVWDVFFTKHGVWGFNPTYLVGIYFMGLPLEEILFFVFIPFSCVFTYHCLHTLYSLRIQPKTEKGILLALALVLLCVGLSFLGRAYTASTFIGLAVLLLVLMYFGRSAAFGRLLLVYPVLLIPFFLVNGVLTGTGLEQPIVWYNDAENLGIRLLTIPFEDVFYGFGLILSNIAFFEYFKKKNS